MSGNGNNMFIFSCLVFMIGCFELSTSRSMPDVVGSSPAHQKMVNCESDHLKDGCFDIKAVTECLDKVEKDGGLTSLDLAELAERRRHTARQQTICPALLSQGSCFKRAHTTCFRDHNLEDCKHLDGLIECYRNLKTLCANFVASNELQMKIDTATQRCEEGHGEHKGDKDFYEKVEECIAKSDDIVDECQDHNGAVTCLKGLLQTEKDLTETERKDIEQQIKDFYSWDHTICPALMLQGTCFDRRVEECKADYFENDCSARKETTDCMKKIADVCGTEEAKEEIDFELELLPMCDEGINPDDMDISY